MPFTPRQLDEYCVEELAERMRQKKKKYISQQYDKTKYQDIEKSIRGYKDVFNKDKQEWELKRKKVHCFTDEEAENILRTAQSLLSTDIKLGYIEKDVFGMIIMTFLLFVYKKESQEEG